MLQPLDKLDTLGRIVIATTSDYAIVQQNGKRIQLKRLDAHDVHASNGEIKNGIVIIDGMAFLKDGQPTELTARSQPATWSTRRWAAFPTTH